MARTLDYFSHEGAQFLVEEYVDGIYLGKLLERTMQLDAYVTARILHGLARGMTAVHAEGVVHRDLKPSNIMIAGGFGLEEVKITDFGVANKAAAEIDASIASGLTSITGSRTLIGHLPYLAPEILRKRKTVDLRADIWAIGALTFHLLAGAPPFGTELADAVVQILSAPIPPIPPLVDRHPQLRALGHEIYGIVVACLQREPASRPTAAQLMGLCERLCYTVVRREIGTVSGYPGGSFGFAEAPGGEIFFHSDSVYAAAHPRVGGEIWFARHPGQPRDRAHPVLPLLPENP